MLKLEIVKELFEDQKEVDRPLGPAYRFAAFYSSMPVLLLCLADVIMVYAIKHSIILCEISALIGVVAWGLCRLVVKHVDRERRRSSKRLRAMKKALGRTVYDP